MMDAQIPCSAAEASGTLSPLPATARRTRRWDWNASQASKRSPRDFDTVIERAAAQPCCQREDAAAHALHLLATAPPSFLPCKPPHPATPVTRTWHDAHPH